MTALEQRLLSELEQREAQEKKLYARYIQSLQQIQSEYESALKQIVALYEQKLKEIAEKPVKIELDERLEAELKKPVKVTADRQFISSFNTIEKELNSLQQQFKELSAQQNTLSDRLDELLLMSKTL